MQHLNYCRQAIKSLTIHGPLIPHYVEIDDGKTADEYYAHAKHVFSLLSASVKVQLPALGRILDDSELRCISEGGEVRLPFPVMALEYSKPIVEDTDAEMSYSKRIVIAEEREDRIDVSEVCYSDSLKRWAIFPAVWVPRHGAIKKREDGATVFTVTSSYVEDPSQEPGFADGISALFDLLNALSCKNVHLEKSPGNASKQGKKVKTALPFDDYHFLTVDVPGKSSARGEGFGGSHRSPREHLRRGHIRRLDSGPIWVNACVVNAGIGNKIGKSYLVRKSA